MRDTELYQRIFDLEKFWFVKRGWQGYSFLDGSPRRHERFVPGSGKEAVEVLPWVHTLNANIKGNIRGVHHGVSPKPLPRSLGEFCYRFNRRFWEQQMFNRMLHACLNTRALQSRR